MKLEGCPGVTDRALNSDEWHAVMLVRADKWLDEAAGTDLEDVAGRRQTRAWRAFWDRSQKEHDPISWRDTFYGWARQFEPYCSTVEERGFAAEVEAVLSGRA